MLNRHRNQSVAMMVMSQCKRERWANSFGSLADTSSYNHRVTAVGNAASECAHAMGITSKLVKAALSRSLLPTMTTLTQTLRSEQERAHAGGHNLACVADRILTERLVARQHTHATYCIFAH